VSLGSDVFPDVSDLSDQPPAEAITSAEIGMRF